MIDPTVIPPQASDAPVRAGRATWWVWPDAKVVDLALAVSVAGWSVGAALGLGAGPVAAWPARAAVAALHAVAAWLFVRRTPATQSGAIGSLVAALPSLLVSGLSFRFGAAQLAGLSLALFVTGALGACASLLTLGRSFAVFAARRALVVRGLYRLVRHPAYASELLMVLATAGAGGGDGSPQNVLVALALLLAALASVVVRVRAEEHLLATDAAYRAYAARVPHRLVPGLW